MQMKTIMKLHLTPVGVPIIQKKDMYLQRCGEIETSEHYFWEWNMVQLLWKTVLRCHKKIKIELPHDPTIPLLEIYAKELKSGSWNICTTIFIAA